MWDMGLNMSWGLGLGLGLTLRIGLFMTSAISSGATSVPPNGGLENHKNGVFCQAAQKWQKEMVSTHKKGKDIRVMVWAAIWWKYGKVHKSDMVILGRDWECKKMGYTANSYLDVLDDQLPKSMNQASFSCKITRLSIQLIRSRIGLKRRRYHCLIGLPSLWILILLNTSGGT